MTTTATPAAATSMTALRAGNVDPALAMRTD